MCTAYVVMFAGSQDAALVIGVALSHDGAEKIIRHDQRVEHPGAADIAYDICERELKD